MKKNLVDFSILPQELNLFEYLSTPNLGFFKNFYELLFFGLAQVQGPNKLSTKLT
jgi:hypothetical protein